MKKLEAKFKLKNVDTQVLKLFGLGPGQHKTYTAYGALVNETDGAKIQRVVSIRGRLGKAEADTMKAKDLAGYDYAIRSIVSYEDVVGGEVIHKFDLFTNELIVGGVDQNAEHNRLLAIR